MTMIAGLKYNNEGCVISDFRITDLSVGSHFDVAQKYTPIGNRMMIYIAGAVYLLGDIRDRVNNILDQITHENVDNRDGPFITEIFDYFRNLGFNVNLQCQMIVVHLCIPNDTFKMFRLDFLLEDDHWKYDLISDSDFRCQVIGSGAIILDQTHFTDRELMPLSSLYTVAKNRGYTQETAIYAVESEIKSRLDALGTSIYTDLGIGPVFNVALINGSHLGIIGREINGGTFDDTGEKTTFSYIIEGEGDSNIKLTDCKTGDSIIAARTDTFDPNMFNSPIRFDPEGKENS